MEDKKQYGIAEIAEICGVSKATVSRVINDKEKGVGKETRERILRTIEELKYRPNALARSVATAKSHMVGLIVPDVSNFFYPKVIRGVMDAMDARGYSVIVCNSDYKPEREADQLLKLIDRRVDGIILCSGTSNKDFLSDFRKYHVPIGLMGRSYDIELSDVSISGDNTKGAFKSSSYLIEKGHKHIAYLEGNFKTSGGMQRLQGYRQALSNGGIPEDPKLLLEGDYTIEFGRSAADKLLAGPKFDAVITGSDLIAIGLVDRLIERGVRIPEKVEVIGYDDIDLASLFRPKLSTMSKPHYKMAQYIAELLVQKIEGKSIVLPHVKVEPELVLRDTTRNR